MQGIRVHGTAPWLIGGAVILLAAVCVPGSSNSSPMGGSTKTPADRSKLAQWLASKQGFALSPAAAQALSHAMPEPVASELLSWKGPDYLHLSGTTAPLDDFLLADTSKLFGQRLCIFSTAIAECYLAVVEGEGSASRIAWDTVVRTPLPQPGLSRAVLGIERGPFATIIATGLTAVSHLGNMTFVLIEWTGKTGRVICTLNGRELDTVDLDGDGVRELNAPQFNFKKHEWEDRVYEFDRAMKSFGFVPGLKTQGPDSTKKR